MESKENIYLLEKRITVLDIYEAKFHIGQQSINYKVLHANTAEDILRGLNIMHKYRFDTFRCSITWNRYTYFLMRITILLEYTKIAKILSDNPLNLQILAKELQEDGGIGLINGNRMMGTKFIQVILRRKRLVIHQT